MERHELIRSRIAERPKEDRVDQRKDRAARSDPDGQRQHDRSRKAWPPAHPAKSVTEVSRPRFKLWPSPCGSSILEDQGSVAERAASRIPVARLFRFHLDVHPHLLAQIRVDGLPVPPAPQFS